MEHSTAQRQLVKSPPELWAEVSCEDALGRHLASFGEIRITRMDPETTVAWEGERASGTVHLEPTGWGTKVILTATPDPGPAPPAEPEPSPQAASAPPPQAQPAAPDPHEPAVPPALEQARSSLLARVFRRRIHRPAPACDLSPPAPGPQPMPPAADPAPTLPAARPAPAPPTADPGAASTREILDEVLETLGGAHHRPFSRD